MTDASGRAPASRQSHGFQARLGAAVQTEADATGNEIRQDAAKRTASMFATAQTAVRSTPSDLHGSDCRVCGRHHSSKNPSLNESRGPTAGSGTTSNPLTLRVHVPMHGVEVHAISESRRRPGRWTLSRRKSPRRCRTRMQQWRHLAVHPHRSLRREVATARQRSRQRGDRSAVR